MAAFASRIMLRIGNQAISPILPLFVQTLLPAGATVGTLTGLIAGVSSLGSAISSPLIGSWSDRFGQRRLLIICAVAAGLFYLPQPFVHDPRTLIFWQFCSGFAIGGTLATLTACRSPSSHPRAAKGWSSGWMPAPWPPRTPSGH